MKLVLDVHKAIWDEYKSYKEVYFYISKWHESDDYGNWENFPIIMGQNKEIDLSRTLHSMNGEILVKVAIDIGVETPDFIPCIPTFRNEIKSEYKTASATFEKAFKQIESHPDTAIGLANSALESIIKEILKDPSISTKVKGSETLYALSTMILREFRLLSDSDMPQEIKTIGNSLLTINQNIEKIRSEKTNFHGKTGDDPVIEDPIYTYFIVNSVATVGLFLNSYYKSKFNKNKIESSSSDDLPF